MKTLNRILGEHIGSVADTGSPVANSMEPEDRPSRQMLAPRGVPALDHKKIVPGVTDQDDIFSATNLRRSVPNPNDVNSHGHTPAPRDELQYESLEGLMEAYLDEAKKKKKDKPKKKGPFKDVAPFDDHQLAHMCVHLVNAGCPASDALKFMSTYRSKFPVK